MIVICENCGKRHQIDPEQIRGVMITFQCDVCNHLMTFANRANNPGNLPPVTPGDPEDINWEEVIKEQTPSAHEATTETPPEPAPPPLTPGDSEDIKWAEMIKETTLSAPETKREEPPMSGFDETRPVNQEKLEFIDLAEQIEEQTPSAPETKREEPPELAPPPLTPGDSEDIKWAEVIEEQTPSAPETTTETPLESGFDEPWFVNQEKPKFIGLAEQNEETIPSAPETKREEPPKPAPHKMRGVGVRGRMFFLFLLVPICLIIAAVFIHRNSIKTLTGLIIKESSQLVTKMAENAIAEKGRFVAKEVERYLLSYPDLPKEDFMQDPVLKSIGVQKVGKTGYTYLISMRTPTEVSALWLHPDEKLIGKDVVTVMRNALGDEYKRWNMIQGVAFTQGKEAAGYYTWHDRGQMYMVMVPVEGTGFFVTSTALLDEYTAPMKQLEGRVNELTAAAIRIMTIVLVATALIIVLFFVIYNYPLSGRLKNAFDAADYIGVDDLEVETGRNKWGDKSGKAAPAIRRMQGSIHHAIKRLREGR